MKISGGVDKVYNELVSIRTPPSPHPPMGKLGFGAVYPPVISPNDLCGKLPPPLSLCVLTTFNFHFKADCPGLYNTLVLGAPFALHESIKEKLKGDRKDVLTSHHSLWLGNSIKKIKTCQLPTPGENYMDL